jgi:hypothetical protein
VVGVLPVYGEFSVCSCRPHLCIQSAVTVPFFFPCTSTEPCRVNRICLWSDREGSDETSQLVMLSRSTEDPRVISITSSLQPLQKVGSLAWFKESRNSTRVSPLSLQLVLPHAIWCALELYPMTR